MQVAGFVSGPSGSEGDTSCCYQTDPHDCWRSCVTQVSGKGGSRLGCDYSRSKDGIAQSDERFLAFPRVVVCPREHKRNIAGQHKLDKDVRATHGNASLHYW